MPANASRGSESRPERPEEADETRLPRSGAAADASALYRAAVPSVVFIVAPGPKGGKSSFGTGLVLTAAHVVAKGDGRVRVFFRPDTITDFLKRT